ncbi:hypothetical protein KKC47_02990, partial [Patescibacteria group bacterium]|nr:hypothetical protein [Patescibacteria group bacterium]
PYYTGGRERLAAQVGSLMARAGHYSIYGPLQSSLTISPPFTQPPEPLPNKPLIFADGTTINAYQTEIKPDRLLIHFDLTLGREPNETKIFTFTLIDATGKQLEIESPLINDLHQPINAGAAYEFVADFSFYKKLAEKSPISIKLKTLEATQILDALGSTVAHPDQETSLGIFELD